MSISAEEFQQFQAQLLGLREANINSNEARYRAERRVKELEASLAIVTTSNRGSKSKQVEHIKLLEAEKAELFAKLFSNESEFQQQCSTLKTECHSLRAEVNRLTTLLDNQTAFDTLFEDVHATQTLSSTVSTQTIETVIAEAGVQLTTAFSTSTNVGVQTLPPDSEDLEISLNAYYDLLQAGLASLDNRVTKAECDMAGLASVQSQAVAESKSLSAKVADLERALATAKTVEDDLLSQLVAERTRSRRMSKDLRRQVARLVRNSAVAESLNSPGTTTPVNGQHELDGGSASTARRPQNNPVGHQRQISSASSISEFSYSSLSSITPSTQPVTVDQPEHITRGETRQHNADGFAPVDFKLPQDFIPVSDFKAVLDRMSEVQEENCNLRRLVQRLQADLAAKSMALQTQLTNHLSDDSRQLNSGRQSVATATISAPPSGKWLSSLVKPFTSFPSSVGGISASVSVETVNRLKKLCEDLLTENFQLRDRLKESSQT